jgi:hypothetical protein
MTTEITTPRLGSIQENPAPLDAIIANIRAIIADALSPTSPGSSLTPSETAYLAYSYFGDVPLSQEQWAKHNGWGRYFTDLERGGFRDY